MVLLEVQNLTMKFGGLVANRDVSMVVNEGEVVGLIGPNGAGKTTCFNCIAGYYRPDSGKVRFLGQDVTGRSPHDICRRGIARTFQIVKSFRDMTVMENVMVGAFLRDKSTAKARRKALEVVEMVGLFAKKDLPAASLTVPHKKRLELARALATGPRLLMLDEVMAGLNPRERQDAVALLKLLRSEGYTLLMVEHVMEVIMPISDRLVVLDSGIKLAEGTPREVSSNEEVIKAYLGERYRVKSN